MIVHNNVSFISISIFYCPLLDAIILPNYRILFVIIFIVNVINPLNKIILSSHWVRSRFMLFDDLMRNRSNSSLRSKILSLYFYSFFYLRAQKGMALSSLVNFNQYYSFEYFHFGNFHFGSTCGYYL